jgi:hypothetical protein
MTAPSTIAAPPAPGSAYQRGAQLDKEARAIAQDVLAGRRDEADARWAIAALVMQSQLASVQARRFRFMPRENDQSVQDLADRLTYLLIRKIAGDGTLPATLDLSRLAGTGSLSAWISRLSQPALLSIQRDLGRANRRNGTPYEPTEYHELGNAFYDEEPDATANRLAVEDAIEHFVGRRKKTRGTKLTHLQAFALCAGLGVPAPQRVEDDSDAALARAALAADPHAASDTVNHLARGADVEAARHTILARIWDGQPRHILELLASADPRVPHAITLAVVTPLPPLDRSTVKKVRRDCLTELGTSSGAQTLSSVVTAWAERCSGMRVSEHCPGLADPLAPENLKTAADRAADRAAFEAAVTALLELKITFLGRTPEEIAASLQTRFDQLDDRSQLAIAG